MAKAHQPVSGVIILTVSGGYQSQKMGLFPLTHHLGGDFDHGKIMRPEFWAWNTFESKGQPPADNLRNSAKKSSSVPGTAFPSFETLISVRVCFCLEGTLVSLTQRVEPQPPVTCKGIKGTKP